MRRGKSAAEAAQHSISARFRPKFSRTHKPDDLALDEWQRILRKQYAEVQRYDIKNIGDHPVFSEFLVTNPDTAKTYRVAIRGEAPGDNYCSCPDYHINNLGTCKHIEQTLLTLKKKRGAAKAFRQGYEPPYSEIYLSYGVRREVRFRPGKDAPPRLLALARGYFDQHGVLRNTRILEFPRFFDKAARIGHEVRCYDDVMSYIAEYQDAERRRTIAETHLKEGADCPLFRGILKTPLYPYQREGALFAVKAGRCLIGDDMGLGKTIQALAASELMSRLFGIQKVLVVSPTSLKHQWKTEIESFSGRSVDVIEGLNRQRKALYRNDSFYKLTNYELIFRDIGLIREWEPDLIILDEAQRIKNWKTRTARTVKQLDSPFAIVLTGTPLENKIEELHSLMEFIDRRRLGPLYRFVHKHRITDEGGKVIGYKGLQEVRQSLKDVMIRRRKADVLRQLPERIDKTFFVPMTAPQREIHDEYYDIVVKLVAKWRRFRFLCEADQRRLLIALNYMRMASDNTYLVDKKTVHGPKLEELETLLREIVLEGGEKVVIFSQWLRMTALVEEVLSQNGIGYAHLNGSIPSRERRNLITRFREDPDCMVFLSTDAGGVGLNLQSGSVVINMDIPWNPAVLEQRIGRVHRLGQRRKVTVVNFVSSSSIEERILGLLAFKKSLFSGVLDSDGESVVMLGEPQFKRFMHTVEELSKGLEKSDAKIQEQLHEEESRDTAAADLIESLEASGNGDLALQPAADAAPGPADALSTLLVSGAQFLMDISRTLTHPDSPAEGRKDSMIIRDETTGTAYLKIPLPAKNVVENLLSSLSALFLQKH